jgi:tRNA pseudouridine55 synthase
MSKPRRFFRDVDGILLFDKPLGLSSNAALQQVRELFGALKAGHAGSLDPLASGLLPVCFGQATKVCGRLLNSGKTYRVIAELGARTESGDCETGIAERAPIPQLTEASVDAVLMSFLGQQQQIPPMHSALKFEGQRLYELARRGESVERPPRSIVIHRLERVGLGPDRLEFDVDCSKGTYIRTLAADIAQRLGTLGYVKGLRRVSLDPFGGLKMHTLEELTQLETPTRDGLLLAPDAAFVDLPSVTLDALAERSLLQGQSVSAAERAALGELRAYSRDGRFLGIVEGQGDGKVKPSRLFVTAAAEPRAKPAQRSGERPG